MKDSLFSGNRSFSLLLADRLLACFRSILDVEILLGMGLVRDTNHPPKFDTGLSGDGTSFRYQGASDICHCAALDHLPDYSRAAL